MDKILSSIESKYQTFIKKDWEYDNNVARAVALAMAEAALKHRAECYITEITAKKITGDKAKILAQKKIKNDILLRPELTTEEEKWQYVKDNYLRVIVYILPYDKKDKRKEI